jgi:hypothetical protein
MPKIHEMLPSKYLKKEDVSSPKLLTIHTVTQETVGTGDDTEEKWILHFQEDVRPMVLNSTNMRLIEMVTGSDDSDEWSGHKVVLYSDPNISFGGKLVGGIRIRAPQKPKTAPVKPGTVHGKPKGDPAPNEPLPPEAESDAPF